LETLILQSNPRIGQTNQLQHDHTSTTSSFQVREISLKFPHFDGLTPVLEWIFKAKKFFQYHHTPDFDCVNIAAMHFKKDVVPWFQMLHRMHTIKSWTDLTSALETQFGPSPFECPMASLFKLQQTGFVSDYYLQFMHLANKSQGLSDEALINCFVGGLNKDIRRDVIAMTPFSLMCVVSLAKLCEEKYMPSITLQKSSLQNSIPKYS